MKTSTRPKLRRKAAAILRKILDIHKPIKSPEATSAYSSLEVYALKVLSANISIGYQVFTICLIRMWMYLEETSIQITGMIWEV